MLYYLFDWLDRTMDFPGAGVFQYISFRAAASMVTSLLIMLLLGKPFIRWMQNKLGMMDEVRTELGLEGAEQKAKTPTMGGLLILTAIIVPTLLFAKLDNIYVLIMLGTTLWMGMVGFLDDYLTVDKYFKINYPLHNLVRTRCQLALAKDIMRKQQELEWIVRETVREAADQ